MTSGVHEKAGFRCLSRVEAGQRVRLAAIRAGRGVRSRLAAMGLVPGVELEVIHNSAWGPFIVAVKESRVVLGRGMAEKVDVE
jgi:ferrous iron transport protein A